MRKLSIFWEILHILSCAWIPPPTSQWCLQPPNPVHNTGCCRRIPSYLIGGKARPKCSVPFVFKIGSQVAKISYAALSYRACPPNKQSFPFSHQIFCYTGCIFSVRDGVSIMLHWNFCNTEIRCSGHFYLKLNGKLAGEWRYFHKTEYFITQALVSL
jgi:hypothetical protein